MQTRTPAPVEPPNAHSRVTRSGHSTPIEMRSPAPAGRLHAGRSAAWGVGSCCATAGSYGAGRLAVGQEAAELLHDLRLRLDSFGLQRAFEVGEDLSAEGGVGLGSRGQLVGPATGTRKLLGRPHPAFGRRGKDPDQPSQPLFVVCAHHVTCPLDGAEGAFLPSNASRSLSRQREMRLAIVPAGRPSVSPIVR